MITLEIANRLNKKYGSSFYVFYPDVYKLNLDDFCHSFRRYYQNTILSYSFKANYMPLLGKILKDGSHWGEVVSRLEYEIALLNLPPNHIIFNGPFKSFEDIERAVSNGSLVNIDSLYELEHFEKLSYRHRKIELGIRLNFPISDHRSRFGISIHNGDLHEAINFLKKLKNVDIVCLHSHFSTKDKSIDTFIKRITKMVEVSKQLDLPRLKYIDIGGGFFGKMPPAIQKLFDYPIPSFRQYGKAIGKILHRFFGDDGPHLIVEPGVSLVADAFKYVCKIIDIKEVGDIKYALVDSSVNILYPTQQHKNLPFEVLSPIRDIKQERYTIVGYTCMEHDVIKECYIGSLHVGDYLVFHNRGAYSINYKPPFIKQSPPVIDINGNLFKAEETVENILSTYKL